MQKNKSSKPPQNTPAPLVFRRRSDAERGQQELEGMALVSYHREAEPSCRELLAPRHFRFFRRWLFLFFVFRAFA